MTITREVKSDLAALKRGQETREERGPATTAQYYYSTTPSLLSLYLSLSLSVRLSLSPTPYSLWNRNSHASLRFLPSFLLARGASLHGYSRRCVHAATQGFQNLNSTLPALFIECGSAIPNVHLILADVPCQFPLTYACAQPPRGSALIGDSPDQP